MAGVKRPPSMAAVKRPPWATASAAALAGGLLIALAAGCAARSAAPRQATVQGCADYGARVIHQRRTVTREPAACRGLSQPQVEQAVGKAIRLAAGGHHKAVSRRLAVAAGARLAYLITAAPPPPRPQSAPRSTAASGPGAARRRTGPSTAADAALVSWVITAGTGAYLLAGWISHGGVRRPRTRSAGLPPVVIFGHFGLAVTGLLIWAAFVATAVTALAWTAAGLLLPVAGLGFATLALLIGADRPPPATAQGGRQAPSAGRIPVLVIAGHGAVAALTILLVVLAALTP
jgi:manganese efflux pump family protein